MIAVCSVGTTHIDLAYAKEKGIQIINALGQRQCSGGAGYFQNVGFEPPCHRRPPGGFGGSDLEKYHFTGHELKGKALGLLGYGRIGRRVAEIARVIGMRILAYDPYLTAEQCSQAGAEKMELDEILEASDVLAIHLPLTPETDHLISAPEIAKMKDGALIINMSRGGILDEEAAAQGLKSGKLGGVGVDVIKGELADLSGGDVLYSPLFDCGGNYVVSPISVPEPMKLRRQLARWSVNRS